MLLLVFLDVVCIPIITLVMTRIIVKAAADVPMINMVILCILIVLSVWMIALLIKVIHGYYLCTKSQAWFVLLRKGRLS